MDTRLISLYRTVRSFSRMIELVRQRKADASLLYDVRKDLDFLFPAGSVAKQSWYRVLPFDFASAGIYYGNVCFWYTRGDGNVNVSVALREVPKERCRINVVISARDSTGTSIHKPTRDWPQASDLSRPRLEEINEAFSESK
jgi:hypothetical protein